MKTTGLALLEGWFASHRWKPWPFQREAWQASLAGKSGLIHVPTGSGKTYAALMGPLARLIDTVTTEPPANKTIAIESLRILYVTPLRALTRDIEAAIRLPLDELGLPISVDNRTGDTSAYAKGKQKKQLPHILITTPESLAILMSYPAARERFAGLQSILVDEWHELMGSKRGIQLELALARLRQWAPKAQTWGMSATLGNLEQAARQLVGVTGEATLISAAIDRPVTIETLLPDTVDSFPWGGHLGITLLPKVIALLEAEGTTLLFTNTRYQAERWFQELLTARPAWKTEVALHHGSLDLEERRFVEAHVKAGQLRAVVCTSSLDLGVDFPAVERVIQVGSPHGLARLLQRAGRARHRMGETSTIYCVPTHGLELLELAALRRAYETGKLESRFAFEKPLDVLAQHVVSSALAAGEALAKAQKKADSEETEGKTAESSETQVTLQEAGLDREAFYQEVIQAWSYRHLTRQELDWVFALLEHGGSRLKAYPEYHKLRQIQGQYVVSNKTTLRTHRMNIGTITSDASVWVQYVTGGRLGSVEEWFVAKLKPGDVFTFAGKTLEFIREQDKTVLVKKSTRAATVIPRWAGGRLPLSESLADTLRTFLAEPERYAHWPEVKTALPILEAQRKLSRLPKADELLVELCQSREGYHCFILPFEGRLVHEGLASLWASALAQKKAASFSLSVSDYGLELLCKEAFPYEALLPEVLDWIPANRGELEYAIAQSLNLELLAKRQFRDIARITGLILQNYPGQHKTANQLQSSAGLLYDVFRRYDPDNLLLYQARREVLEQLFELERLERTLARVRASTVVFQQTKRPSPLGFPLMVERMASTLTSESLADRVAKLQARWSKVT